jgi:hypothetical protein
MLYFLDNMVHDFDAQYQYPYPNTIEKPNSQFLSRWHTLIVHFDTATTFVVEPKSPSPCIETQHEVLEPTN